jgi:mRNA interferase MazF
MNYRRGDVVLVLFPDSNLRTSKRRSANESGLLMDSVIMTDNLATIHYSEIDRTIGTFTGLKEIDAALRTTLAL